MDSPSTRPLMDHDVMSGSLSASSYSAHFIEQASNNQRASSTPLSLTTGTGYHIYKSLIIPHILSAKREVILVTCFWAPSATLAAIHNALIQLSDQALASNAKIAVHICFSTYSLARNLLLRTPNEGQIYGPSKWRKLGLPEASQIPGLSLRVTRKFFWPWGIIHSKYVVIDREIAIFPSCNVSWERWFEAAISMRGPVVEHLLRFHAGFWENGRGLASLSAPQTSRQKSQQNGTTTLPSTNTTNTSDSTPTCPDIPQPTLSPSRQAPTPTTLLPSPHTPTLLPPHLSPSTLIHSLPCLPDQPPTYPSTPLLTTTTYLLSTAQHTLILISPNITAPTVLSQLRHAISRGVNVTIWTNQRLMTAEQLVTAGTTTPTCLKKLERWRATEARSRSQSRSQPQQAQRRPDTGQLRVHYFDDDSSGPGTKNAQAVARSHRAKKSNGKTSTTTTTGPIPTTPTASHAADIDKKEEEEEQEELTAVKLHAKVTIVDGNKILLGSGNMDAASWGTSQELGVLIEGEEVVREFVERGQWPWGGLVTGPSR